MYRTVQRGGPEGPEADYSTVARLGARPHELRAPICGFTFENDGQWSFRREAEVLACMSPFCHLFSACTSNDAPASGQAQRKQRAAANARFTSSRLNMTLLTMWPASAWSVTRSVGKSMHTPPAVVLRQKGVVL